MSTFIVYRSTDIVGPAVRLPHVHLLGKSHDHLSEQQARAIGAPWYSLFNIATRGDLEATQQAALTEDYESCAGYLPAEHWGRDTSIRVVSNFANTIPDMKFDVKEVLVAGDRVIVRGEVTGTPSGEFVRRPAQQQQFSDHGRRYPDHQRRQNRKNLPHGKLAERDRAK